ncbi:MAG: NAD(P)H-dependent glycerol-3-phosphate dehydrogenase [bacterium]
MKDKITILGGGSWGTAIAQLLAKNGHQVMIYDREEKIINSIKQKHINIGYFPEYTLSDKLMATNDLNKAVSFGDIVFMSVPTYATRDVMSQIEKLLRGNQFIVSTAKGIEEKSFLRNSQIISEYTNLPVAVLSGPTHAEEVMDELPTTAVITCNNKEIAKKIQDIMMSSTFRVYTNPDIVGIEIGGAIKNIIAVSAGIADGLGYGDNTKAALMTRGLHEMSRLGVYLGAKLLTFAGLTGMGDLVVTCTSMHSRNRRLGIKIGKGLGLDKALESISQTVEGVRTTRAIYQWYIDNENELDFDIPITKQIYKVLFKNKDPMEAVNDLMQRGPKHEIEEVIENISW